MKKQLQEVETARRKLVNGDAEAKPTKTGATPPAPASTPTNGATVVVPASAMVDADAAIAESDARSVYVGNVGLSNSARARRVLTTGDRWTTARQWRS